jgi:hypothetical protein
MAKNKGIERVKTTDKSIKADHKGQNIIQTVRVVVQTPNNPKEPTKRKSKSKSKSSSKGAVSVSKKEAIAELQSVMTKFRALKDQAQKMGIKLPISIGESAFVPADIKTVADIQGLIAELRIKNSQIEALLQSPAQSGLSSQLPQQASSFAPQIVESSEPAKVEGQIPKVVPQVSPSTGPTTSDKETQSDKDIEDILNSVPKVSDEDVDKDLEKATGQTPTGSVVQDEVKVATSEIVSEQGNATTTVVDGQQVLIKLNQLKDQARNANTLEVQKVLAQQIGYDLATKDRGTITGELKNKLETLPVDSLDNAYVYFKTSILLDQRGNMGTISPNIHDNLLKSLKMLTNVTYTDQFTDLKGYHKLLVETDMADVDIMSPSQSGIHGGGHSGEGETQAEMIAEVQANEEKGRLLKQQEEARKEQEAALKMQQEDQIRADFIRKQDEGIIAENDLYDDLVGDKESSDSQIAEQLGLPEIPKEQVMSTLTDKIEGVDASKSDKAETLMKELRLIIDKSSPEQLQGVEISDGVQTSIKMSYKTLLGEEYNGPALKTYSIVDENVLKPYQNALKAMRAKELEDVKKEQTLKEQKKLAEEQAKQDEINKDLAEREAPVDETSVGEDPAMTRPEFVKIDNALQDIGVNKSIPIDELKGLNLEEISVIDRKANYIDFQTNMSNKNVFKGDPVKYLSVLLIMSQGDGSQFTYADGDYQTQIVTDDLVTEVKRRLREVADPLKINFKGWNKGIGKDRTETYGDLVNKTNDILKKIRDRETTTYGKQVAVRPANSTNAFGFRSSFMGRMM